MGKHVYYVKTTLGDALINQDSSVPVNIAEDTYLIKRGCELNQGEKVLYHNESITTTLDEVIPILERSRRYSFARDVIHERNSEGELIPKFRIDLIDGLCQKLGINTIDDLILKEKGNDYSVPEKKMMTSEIKKVLDKYGIQRSETSIRNWIEGKTLSVSDWEAYKALAEINPVFLNYYNHQGKMDSYHFNYKLFTTIHRNIMSYLAKKGCSQQKNDEEQENLESEYNISLKNEIELVVNNFMEKVNEETSHAQIISITKIKGSEGKKREKANPNLSKGIVTKKPDSSYKIISIEETANYFSLLSDCFLKLLKSYIRNNLKEDFKELDEKEDTSEFYYENQYVNSLSNMFSVLIENSEKRKKFENKEINEEKDEEKIEIDKHIRKTFNSIYNGLFDEYFNLRKGTILSMIEKKNHLRDNLPPQIKEVMILSNSIENAIDNAEEFGIENLPSETYELMDEYERLSKKVEREYGFSNLPKKLLTQIIECYKSDKLVIKAEDRIYNQSNEKILSSPDFAKFIKDADTAPFSEKEIKETLNLFNLDQLITLFEEEFKLQEIFLKHQGLEV